MNEKDFNRAVLSQLYEISAQVFGERVTVHRDGKEVEDEQFTASEIVNGKDSIGREIEILLKGEPGDVFTVEIDGFRPKGFLISWPNLKSWPGLAQKKG